MSNRKNQGFSLVELIVTLAIMAVLVGILAPSLLRYVEKSRVQKDESAVAEFCNALFLAASDIDNYESIPDAGLTFSYDSTSRCLKMTPDEGSCAFSEELKSVMAGDVKLASNTWTAANISVRVVKDWDSLIVTSNFPADSNIVIQSGHQAPAESTES